MGDVTSHKSWTGTLLRVFGREDGCGDLILRNAIELSAGRSSTAASVRVSHTLRFMLSFGQLISLTETERHSGCAPPRNWHLQVSHSAVKPYHWKTLYTFTETVEFLHWDIKAANLAVCRLPGQVFYHTVVCMRRFEVDLCSADSSEMAQTDDTSKPQLEKLRWMGRWTLEGGKLTRRIGHHLLEERKLGSEKERIQVIREVFGIDLADKAENVIRGRDAALDSSVRG